MIIYDRATYWADHYYDSPRFCDLDCEFCDNVAYCDNAVIEHCHFSCLCSECELYDKCEDTALKTEKEEDGE